LRFSNAALLRRALRALCSVVQCALFSALILIPRCANYENVFVGGKIYFLDADCYARMTRARMIAEHPGTIVRQHDFENYPAGVTPHTTAPFDYLIVFLSWTLSAFTAQPLDLAGAIISPLLALAGGWFLWWWSRRIAGPGRYAALLLYALSAILVHGTALGRPDHQSLLIVALLAALAAEWTLQEKPSRGWSVVSGLGWGLALWVSLYEPLILLGGLALCSAPGLWSKLRAAPRRVGWSVLLGVVLLAALVERRWPEWPGLQPFFANWSATIGELKPVGLTNTIWFDWCGALILLSPLLLALAWKRRALPRGFAGLLLLTFLLTLWEARWGYFFALIFLFTLPGQIAVVRPKWLAWCGVALVLLPLRQFWPNEQTGTRRAQDRMEAAQWRAAASGLAGLPRAPVLAPWWLSPATAYWSGQPSVAGSSHESLPGIAASARFYLATAADEAEVILRRRDVQWVFVSDGERVAENSAALLGVSAPDEALCRVLDRSPSKAPPFLRLTWQNGACKVYRVRR
jgi:hypothetical protein